MAIDLEPMIHRAKASGNLYELIQQIPYARMIGVSGQMVGEDVLFKLSPEKTNIGNPMLPALHGGVIGGFMETAAIIHLLLFMEQPRIPSIVDFSLDYLRSGKLADTYAECHVHRQGRRVANIGVSAWQTHRDEPITTARIHLRL